MNALKDIDWVKQRGAWDTEQTQINKNCPLVPRCILFPPEFIIFWKLKNADFLTNFFFFVNFIFLSYFICIDVFPVWTSKHHLHAWSLRRTEKSTGSPQTGAINSHHARYWTQVLGKAASALNNWADSPTPSTWFLSKGWDRLSHA